MAEFVPLGEAKTSLGSEATAGKAVSVFNIIHTQRERERGGGGEGGRERVSKEYVCKVKV